MLNSMDTPMISLSPPFRPRTVALAAVAALVLAGCAQMPEDHEPGRVLRAEGLAAAAVPPPPPMTADELVAMARQGRDAAAIIDRIRATRLAFRPTAAEIIDLHARGVPLPVLDHVLAAERGAQADLLAAETARRDAHCAEELRRLDQQWWLRCQMAYPPFPHFPWRRWP